MPTSPKKADLRLTVPTRLAGMDEVDRNMFPAKKTVAKRPTPKDKDLYANLYFNDSDFVVFWDNVKYTPQMVSFQRPIGVSTHSVSWQSTAFALRRLLDPAVSTYALHGHYTGNNVIIKDLDTSNGSRCTVWCYN